MSSRPLRYRPLGSEPYVGEVGGTESSVNQTLHPDHAKRVKPPLNKDNDSGTNGDVKIPVHDKRTESIVPNTQAEQPVAHPVPPQGADKSWERLRDLGFITQEEYERRMKVSK